MSHGISPFASFERAGKYHVCRAMELNDTRLDDERLNGLEKKRDGLVGVSTIRVAVFEGASTFFKRKLTRQRLFEWWVAPC